MAAFVFPVMGLVAVLAARSGANKVALGVYTAGVTGMYAASACYHRGNWKPTTKARLRRLDHSMILVGIASTYTAVAVLGLSQKTAWALLAAVWALAIAGAVMHSLWLSPPLADWHPLHRRRLGGPARSAHNVDRARSGHDHVADSRWAHLFGGSVPF